MSETKTSSPLDLDALRALCEAPGLWLAPWRAHTFEIDCPCPNGEHCGNGHTCEEVESPEAYPDSPERPAAEGEGQCVVQICVPGLEEFARPTAAFIAAARTALPALLDEVARLRAQRTDAERLEALAKTWPYVEVTALLGGRWNVRVGQYYVSAPTLSAALDVAEGWGKEEGR